MLRKVRCLLLIFKLYFFLKFGLTSPISPLQGITESFGAAICGLNSTHLTDGVINRSKRMMLDTLGVGLIGTKTAVFNKALLYSQVQKTLHASHVHF